MGEFIAAAILELIHSLHQADVALLDQIQELEPAICVFFSDRNHEAQIGLDHLLLRPRTVPFAAADGHVHPAELRDRQPAILRHCADLATHVRRRFRMLGHEQLPPAARQLGNPLHPIRIKLVAAIFFQELVPRNLALLTQTQQLTLERVQPLAQLLKLGDQFLDSVVVQADLLDQADKLLALLFVTFFRTGIDLLAQRHRLQPARLGPCAASCRAPRSPRTSRGLPA